MSQKEKRCWFELHQGITNRLAVVLCHNIKTIFKPTAKIQRILTSVKDKQDPLSIAGVYRVFQGTLYVREKHSVNTSIKKHRRCCRFIYPEKSSFAHKQFQ